jgi:spermidine synthase
MKPWEQIAEAITPDGASLTLTRHDDEFMILIDRLALMSSRTHGSEDALAAIGCRHARTLAAPCVLIGGLGMGYTLRGALDRLPRAATVVVAELMPAVIEWNRGVLGPLTNHALRDRRVQLVEGNVATLIRSSRDRFDAIMLDVDNGPSAMVVAKNRTMYTDGGIKMIRVALKAGGALAVWSTHQDRGFEQRLRHHGFEASVETVRGHGSKGPKHFVFVARRLDP